MGNEVPGYDAESDTTDIPSSVKDEPSYKKWPGSEDLNLRPPGPELHERKKPE